MNDIDRNDLELPIGTRVRLIEDVDRYPHFVAPKGATGTVVDVGDVNIFAVHLDAPLAGAEEWDNAIHWSLDAGDDPTLDIEATRARLVSADPDSRLYDGAFAETLSTFHAEQREDAEEKIVVTITLEDATKIADALTILIAIDEGEYTDVVEVSRLRDLILTNAHRAE